VTDFLGAYLRGSTALIKAAAKAGSKAGSAIGQATASAASDYSAGRGQRRGILAPGDAAPPSHMVGSYYDYRGVLNLKKVDRAYQDAEFPLGRYLHPARGPREPIALPGDVVARHVTMVGPAGSGKTHGVVVPWIIAALRAGWSVAAIDVKANLMDHVREAVQKSGRPIGVRSQVLDYTRPSRSVSWNWCSELDSDRSIDNAVKAIVGSKPPPHTAPVFFYQESQLLRGLLELTAASSSGRPTNATRLLAVLKDQARLMRIRRAHPVSPAFGRLADLEPLDPRDYADRITGLASKLDALANPTIQAVTAQAGFRVQSVLDTRTLVSVVAPVQDGLMATLLSSLFLNQLLFRAYDRFANPGGVPVLLVLDEAARLQDFVDFEAILSVAREARVAALIALQDAAQFKDENQRSIIFSNSGTLIYLPGTSSVSSQLLSGRLGQHPVQTTSTSVSPAPSGLGSQRTRQTQTAMVPVLGQREISNLPFGPHSAVVHSRPVADPPFLVDLTQ
jgi:type IV secretory pathway TraG/TraD family ATPase VirD4